ncbi:MAG: glycosyltransferase [Lachnospiraceae bacterium]|nr:glycosyltransferase [Lachnospiraceae bacterium]
MITISLCMIVKNEEQVLARCLESVKDIVDEIVLVDTGSEDKTREIARKYTEKIYEFIWQDDFAAARNEAFAKATMDYCMWLDADDVLTKENQENLVELKENLDKDTDIVMMKYAVSEDEDGKPLFSYYRERLIRNGRGFRWEGRVHEAIVPSGKIVYSNIVISHRKVKLGDENRNLRIYEKMIKEGVMLSGRNLFYYGRELMNHRRYADAKKALEQFLDGVGWGENKIEACLNLAECCRVLGQREERAKALLRSFLYAKPRGEACFELGHYFQEQSQWQQAIFWYETALKIKPEAENGGFIRWDYYGYLPEVNLCVCYDRMGDRQMAYQYHQKARERKPEAAEVQWNEKYFRDMGMDEQKFQTGHMIQ